VECPILLISKFKWLPIEECVYFNLSRNVEMNLLSLKVDETDEAGKAA
jgi:hypothetical protein